MKSFQNINYYKDQYLDLFVPEKEEFITIIHFHGGGLVEGDKGDTYQYVHHLVDAGFAVATCNYSLITEKRSPACIYDAAQAIRYVMDNIAQYGQSKGFIVSGQSAGAWLTLMLCLDKDYLEDLGVDNKDICGWISDAGQPTSHFNILKYEKGLDPLLQRIDENAPLYYVSKNTRFSSILLMVYENDLPNRLEQNQLLVSSIKNYNDKANIVLKVLKGYHCHGSSELDDDGEYETIKIIKEWVKSL